MTHIEMPIHNLYARYCHAVDAADPQGISDCFTVDAELIGERVNPSGVVPTSHSVGRDQILRQFMQRPSDRAGFVHDTFNVLLSPAQADGHLVGRAYFRVFTPTAEIECTGRYQDLLQPDGDSWLFKQRRVLFTWGYIGEPGRRREGSA